MTPNVSANARIVASETGRWIQKTSDVCGGDACIRRTRITVWGLVAYQRLGVSDHQLLQNFPGLTQADLDLAWQYAQANPEEIERAIAENRIHAALLQ
jgi:uncharacterized protein (DUF433 family)